MLYFICMINRNIHILRCIWYYDFICTADDGNWFLLNPEIQGINESDGKLWNIVVLFLNKEALLLFYLSSNLTDFDQIL
jgi:hypothetical protein